MTLQQLERAFLTYRDQTDLKIRELEEKLNNILQPHYRSGNVNLIGDDGNGITVIYHPDYNDIFPLPAKPDEKGMYFANDITVAVTYTGEYNPNDSNSGWQPYALFRAKNL